VGFCWLSPGFGERHGFAGAKSAKDWCGFAQLLGDLLWLTARVCKVKSCFARLASQALLASNFCLARQKSPKSRLKDADIPQELQGDRLNGDFEYALVKARSRVDEGFDKHLQQPAI